MSSVNLNGSETAKVEPRVARAPVELDARRIRHHVGRLDGRLVIDLTADDAEASIVGDVTHPLLVAESLEQVGTAIILAARQERQRAAAMHTQEWMPHGMNNCLRQVCSCGRPWGHPINDYP